MRLVTAAALYINLMFRRPVRMFSYVRIEREGDCGRRGGGAAFLGQGAQGGGDDKAEKAASRDAHVQETLKRYYADEISAKWKVYCLGGDLRWFALVTSFLHLLLFFIFLGLTLGDDSNNRARLRTTTTRQLLAWVSSSARPVPVVRDFGPAPGNSRTNITIAHQCQLRGDTPSRSQSYNTRVLIVDGEDVDSRYAMVAFFALSFLFQFTGAYPSSSYERPLLAGRARMSHMVEYSISASLMVLVMCLTTGVTDVYTLSNVFSNTWACMIFGLMSDVFAEQRPAPAFEFGVAEYTLLRVPFAVLAHLAGWVTLLVGTSVVVSNFATFNDCIRGLEIPPAILGGVVAVSLLFMGFGFIQAYTLVVKKGPPAPPMTVDELPTRLQPKAGLVQIQNGSNADTFEQELDTFMEAQQARLRISCRAEYYYILLSLTAKTILAGTMYGGAVVRGG